MLYCSYAVFPLARALTVFINCRRGESGFMNELIKITETPNGKKTVSARELYEFLELEIGQWSRWTRKNIIQNVFAKEGVDWQRFDLLVKGNPTTEFALSLGFAEKLCMLSNTPKGDMARTFFSKCKEELQKIMAERKSFNIPQTYSQALLLAGKLAEENEKQAKQLEDQKPKVEFYDKIIQSETAINMQEVAGVLNIPKMGRNNLFKFLRQNEILNLNNIPYRYYIEAGYFEVKETTRNIKGEDVVLLVTVVSQKGLEFIKRKLDEKNGVSTKTSERHNNE
jgi:anti-repressor protein